MSGLTKSKIRPGLGYGTLGIWIVRCGRLADSLVASSSLKLWTFHRRQYETSILRTRQAATSPEAPHGIAPAGLFESFTTWVWRNSFRANTSICSHIMMWLGILT